MSSAELSTRIKGVIIGVLNLEISPDQLGDDVSLYSSTLQMDSLTLLELMVRFEEEFGIEIDDEDVMNANLRNVGSLIELARGVIAVRAGARANDAEV